MADQRNDDDPIRDQGLEGEQRIDEASGQKAGPPGSGEVDEDAVQEATEKLDQAGGGH